MNQLLRLLQDSETLAWLALGTLALFLLTLLFAFLLIVLIPREYFLHLDQRKKRAMRLHDISLFMLRNVAGILLLLLGVVMLFTPGQGVLFVLLGFVLISFPGKARLVLRLLKVKKVKLMLNALRKRLGKEPLLFPREDPPH